MKKKEQMIPSETLKKSSKSLVLPQEPYPCPSCGGWGTVPNGMDGHPERCFTCEGTGEVDK